MGTTNSLGIQNGNLLAMPTEISGSWHLLFPLLSSIVFVVGALFAKQADVRGANPCTNTVASNICLAVLWGAWGLLRGTFLPASFWGWPAVIASAFILGQLFTYLAFQLGDVSLATPIFGVKIILVAVITSLLAEKPIPPRIWGAAILATIAVGIVQAGGESSPRAGRSSRRTALTVLLALTAALSFSCFDVGVQIYGRQHGVEPFLTTMFVFAGLLSCALLPWTDSPVRLYRLQAIRPLTLAAVLIAIQGISISYALGEYGDATRINIIYSLRGLWSVILVWMLTRMATSPEGWHSSRTMWFRLSGALLLLGCVIVALL